MLVVILSVSIILLPTHLPMRQTEREHSFLDERPKVRGPMGLLSLKEFKELPCGRCFASERPTKGAQNGWVL